MSDDTLKAFCQKPNVVAISEKRGNFSGIIRVKKLKRLKTKSRRFWIRNQNYLLHDMNQFKFLTCHVAPLQAA